MLILNKSYFIFFLLLFTKSVLGQKNYFPIDTIEHNNKKVVLFSNNRWFFLDELSEPKDSIEEYNKNWENKDIFGYLNERGKPSENFYFDITTIEANQFVMPRIGKLYRGFENHHDGLDIGLKMGDSVIAAFDGKVRYAQYHNRGYGNMVIIRHPNGLETWYAHLSKILVKVNQHVKAGELIGLGGMTGRATSPHLHFETRYHDRSFDPLSFIDYDNHALLADIPFKSYFKNGNSPFLNNNDSIKDTNKVFVQKNKINNKKYSTKKSSGVYIIKQGDSLYSIAKKNHTTVQTICTLNKITTKTILKKGRRLIVP